MTEDLEKPVEAALGKEAIDLQGTATAETKSERAAPGEIEVLTAKVVEKTDCEIEAENEDRNAPPAVVSREIEDQTNLGDDLKRGNQRNR